MRRPTTIYNRLQHWSQRGIWKGMLYALAEATPMTRRIATHRHHDILGAPLGCRRKRRAAEQAIGRSRGGRGTKIHLVVDGAGRILTFALTAGQKGDAPSERDLLAPLAPSHLCMATEPTTATGCAHSCWQRGTTPVIPSNPTRQRLHPFDPVLNKRRNIIERAIGRLKDWRRIHTR